MYLHYINFFFLFFLKFQGTSKARNNVYTDFHEQPLSITHFDLHVYVSHIVPSSGICWLFPGSVTELVFAFHAAFKAIALRYGFVKLKHTTCTAARCDMCSRALLDLRVVVLR